MFEKFFDFKKNKTNLKTEILAGITTFMTMAYILAVNPAILSDAGMNKEAVFTATALSAAIATLVMAFVARLPFALAPGMGLNAFFAYTVVISMGYSWEFALTAVFLEGLLFILLTFFNIREMIVDAIPINLKRSISVGIGLFIAFIGLENADIIVNNDVVLLGLGDMSSHKVWVALFGILITGVLMIRKIKGSLLIGMILSTILALLLGVAHLPTGGLFSMPPSISPVFFKLEFHDIFTTDMLIVVVTFLFIDMFDTVGTLVGVAAKAGMLTKEGKVPRVKQALFADAIGTTAGALLGTSTVTTYVESASGVTEGGRTGMTAFSTAVLFIIALFIAPVFIMIPDAATAAALFLVGMFMMSPIKEINFSDYSEAIPAFFTIIMMPLSYSIAEGIVFGMTSYVLLKLLSGKQKEISIVMYVLALLFILKFFL